MIPDARTKLTNHPSEHQIVYLSLNHTSTTNVERPGCGEGIQRIHIQCQALLAYGKGIVPFSAYIVLRTLWKDTEKITKATKRHMKDLAQTCCSIAEVD
jgi:hypothetical protein